METSQPQYSVTRQHKGLFILWTEAGCALFLTVSYDTAPVMDVSLAAELPETLIAPDFHDSAVDNPGNSIGI
jgi:hypothetical protein